MNRTISLVIFTGLLFGCATSQKAAVDQYTARRVGQTTWIERMGPATARSVASALIGTGIAASIQSQPIPLKPGADYACNYQEILTADISESCNRNH
jgi:hypothetical protein